MAFSSSCRPSRRSWLASSLASVSVTCRRSWLISRFLAVMAFSMANEMSPPLLMRVSIVTSARAVLSDASLRAALASARITFWSLSSAFWAYSAWIFSTRAWLSASCRAICSFWSSNSIDISNTLRIFCLSDSSCSRCAISSVAFLSISRIPVSSSASLSTTCCSAWATFFCIAASLSSAFCTLASLSDTTFFHSSTAASASASSFASRIICRSLASYCPSFSLMTASWLSSRCWTRAARASRSFSNWDTSSFFSCSSVSNSSSSGSSSSSAARASCSSCRHSASRRLTIDISSSISSMSFSAWRASSSAWSARSRSAWRRASSS
mmetsp:Transcript_147346/g.257512  ORF Transcript_147346/g.257512 Transcript_147346/m.257512 type:complete len:325 (+) Transcript_147346:182-1156(+)